MAYKDPVRSKEAKAAYYRANAEVIKAKAKAYREQVWSWFRSYKMTLKCEKCGENHPACLDFHHLDPLQKENVQQTVGVMVSKGWSIARIEEEIARCQVLCCNCHRKSHKAKDR